MVCSQALSMRNPFMFSLFDTVVMSKSLEDFERFVCNLL